MRFLTNSNPYPCSEISSQIYGRKKIEEEIKDEIKEGFLFGRNDFSFFFFFFLCNPIFVQRFEPRFRFISLRSGYLNSLYRSTVWLDARMNFLHSRVGAIEISPSSLTTKRRKKKEKSTNLARWTRITANYSSKLKIPIIRTISVKEISVKWISVKKKKKERKKEKKNRKNKMKRQSLN